MTTNGYTHPKNRPKEGIRDTKRTKQEPLVPLVQFSQTSLGRPPRIIPDNEKPLDLLLRLLGHGHIPRIPGNEVRTVVISQC